MSRLAVGTPWSVAVIPEEVADGIRRAEDAERRGNPAAAREHYAWVLSALPKETEPSFTARLIRQIARCHIEDGAFDAAVDCLEVARAMAEAVGDQVALANALNTMGIVELQRGNQAVAESRYHEARSLAQAVGASAVVAMVTQNLGILANIRGDFVSAQSHYEESLAAYERLRMPEKIGPLLNNLGMLYTDLGQWREAERAFADALVRSSRANDTAGFLQAQANRVELYLNRRRFRKAKRVCRDVLARSAMGAQGQWVGETYKHLGVVCRETGDEHGAARHFQRALAESDQRGDPLLTAETLRELAELERRQGRTQETLSALNRAHEIFTKLTARRDLLDVTRRLGSLESDFLEIVRRWGTSIESKDRYTQGHCERVADVACLLAQSAGVPASSLLWFRMGALLHDVGKVMVPEAVLNKAERLSAEEWVIMREHPAAGERLVADAHFPTEVMAMIRHHHERWDGGGYPDRIAAEQIPFWARILCIADVYDALTTTRSYRQGFGESEAIVIMRADLGRAFDPALLDLFLSETIPALARSRSVSTEYTLRLEPQIALAV